MESRRKQNSGAQIGAFECECELWLIAAWPRIFLSSSRYPFNSLPSFCLSWTSGPHSFWVGFCLGSLLLSLSPSLFKRQLTFCFLSFCGQSTKKTKSSCGSHWFPSNQAVVTWRLSSRQRKFLLSASCPAPSTPLACLFWWIDSSDTLKIQLQSLQCAVLCSLLLTALFLKKPNSFGLSKI